MRRNGTEPPRRQACKQPDKRKLTRLVALIDQPEGGRFPTLQNPCIKPHNTDRYMNKAGNRPPLREPIAGLSTLYAARARGLLGQTGELALANLEHHAALQACGIDVIALGSHGLAVDLDATAVDQATGLAGRRR